MAPGVTQEEGLATEGAVTAEEEGAVVVVTEGGGRLLMTRLVAQCGFWTLHMTCTGWVRSQSLCKLLELMFNCLWHV